MKHRLHALDWMRGLVMILMASDHASSAFNADKPRTDSALLYDSAQSLDTLQFLFRWMSHLCAPTFLFLAGTSLALSISRKLERGVASSKIDGDLLVRGLLIVGVELAFVNLFWFPAGVLLQVLYAIGISMILMIPMRRLSSVALVSIAIGVLILTELFLQSTLLVTTDFVNVVRSFLVSPGRFETGVSGAPIALISYPVLPWWSMLALGWAFGQYLRKRTALKTTVSTMSPARFLGIIGACALCLFLIARSLESFGDAGLHKLDNSIAQWLHVSKYPPSLTYVTLELGLMACCLALFFRVQDLGSSLRTWLEPLRVLGQTAFFFYVAHIFLLETSARWLGIHKNRTLGVAVIAWVLVTLLLYPLCLAYRSYKSTHPQSLARYF